jgi:biopolymer transport protein ExbB
MTGLVEALSYRIRGILETGGIAIVPMFALGTFGFFLLLQAFTQPGALGRGRVLRGMDAMILRAQAGIGLLADADRNPLLRIVAETLTATVTRTPEEERAARIMLGERLSLRFYRMMRHLAIIRVLAAAAPLLGLLGTVSGLIRTFDAMHRFGFGNSGLLASGISEALMATQCGLALAILLLIIGQFQEGRIIRLKDEMESRIAVLLRCVFEKESPIE